MKKKKYVIFLVIPFLLGSCGQNSGGGDEKTSEPNSPSANSSASIPSEATSSQEASTSEEPSTEYITSESSEEPIEESSSEPITPASTYSEKNIPFYKGATEASGTVKTYFINHINNIPYLGIASTLKSETGLQVTESDGVITATMESTGGVLTISKADNTVKFSDYYALFGKTDSPSYVSSWANEKYFKETEISYEAGDEGFSTTVSLSDYNIQLYDLIDDDDNHFLAMPAATYFDLFNYASKISYNGEGFYATSGIYDSDGALTEYGSAFKNISDNFVYDETLRDFSYYELCLALDFNYAMKDLLDITKFDTYFRENGIRDIIYDGEPDAKKFDTALNVIFNEKLNDNGHTYITRDASNMFLQEQYASNEITTMPFETEASIIRDAIRDKKLASEIAQAGIWAMPKSRTVILNFDSFQWFKSDDDGNLITEDKGTSSSIVKIANDYIQNNYDDYDNVVIDLTTNGGGSDMAELYMSSWIRGEAYQYTYATMSNMAKCVTKYVADVNLDGVYDSKDNIADKNVYLLTSGYSYSNANVIAGELKGSKNVTLIGQKTCGGSCNTLTYATTLGNTYHLATLTRATNSKWESLENGVEPDIVIENYADDAEYASIVSQYILKDSNN